MKKLAIILLSVLLVLCFASCGSKEKTKNDNSPSSQSLDTDTKAESTEKAEEKTQPITFSEQTAIDDEFCTVKFTGINPNEDGYFTVKIEVENKFDKQIIVSLHDTTVNGIVYDPMASSSVLPGKKDIQNVEFSKSIFKENGVDDFTDIAFDLRVYESSDGMSYSFNDLLSQKLEHVYPYGIEKATRYTREAQPTDKVLIDDEHVTAIVTGYKEEDGDYSVKLYLENKTDKFVKISTRNESINGIMMSPSYIGNTVSPGAIALSELLWRKSSLTDKGIDKVNDIEFNFVAYKSEYGSHIIDSDDKLTGTTVKLQPEG